MDELEPNYRYPDAPMSLVLWYGKDYAGSPNRRMVSTEPMFEDFIRDVPEINTTTTLHVLQALRRALQVQGKRDDDPNVSIHRNGITLKRPFTYEQSPAMRGVRHMGPKTVLLLQHLAYFAQLGYEKDQPFLSLEEDIEDEPPATDA